MNKKLIALCLICSILGSSTSALASTKTSPALATPINVVVTPNLGGGPSPSAVWTYQSSTNKVFTRSQIQTLYNQSYAAFQAGAFSSKAYNFALIVVSFLSTPTAVMSSYIGFCTNNQYYSSNINEYTRTCFS